VARQYWSDNDEGQSALSAVEELADTLTAARTEAQEAKAEAEKWEAKADDLEAEVRDLTAEVADLTQEVTRLRARDYEITGENT
jgi:outer membrane murein-binding lipoprotein Lpp